MISKKIPLVSVLLPSYNHERFIEEAIMSVMEQTYPNIQLIVIDDGSTDRSPEIIDRLQRKYGFEYYQQENKGLIYTLNRLEKKIKGEYVSLFSSDDVYCFKKIEILVDFLELTRGFSMVYSKMALINSESIVFENIEEDYKEGEIFYHLLCGDFFINGLTTLIRTHIYKKYLRDKFYIDDFQYWLKFSKNEKVGFVNIVTAYYRKHNNHLSSDLLKMQDSERNILMCYSNEDGFKYAYNEWLIRWMSSLACQNRMLAVKTYLPKLISFRSFKNLKNIRFYKALIRVVIGKRG